jgi:hypothetical protein
MAPRSFSIGGKLPCERMRGSRLHGSLDVTVLDAHIHVALAIRQVGKLVRALDHRGRDLLRVLLLDVVKNGLDAQSDLGGEGNTLVGHERAASVVVGAALPRPDACSSAAAMKSRNSGAGRSGRDLNSGWNCEATKKG